MKHLSIKYLLVCLILSTLALQAQTLVRPDFVGKSSDVIGGPTASSIMLETTAAANSRRWVWTLGGGALKGQITNDNGTSPVDFMKVTRSGNTITSVEFPKINLTGSAQITSGGVLNWGSTAGATGYGIRDNAGTLEYKNNAGLWQAFNNPAPTGGGWTKSGSTVQLTTGTDTVLVGNWNKIRGASVFSGADAGAQITSATADLPSTGGTVDARGLEGGTWSTDVFSGVTKPVVVYLGTGTTTVSTNVTIPNNVTLVFSEGSILSVNGGSTLTINGSMQGPISQRFAGAGTVHVTAAKSSDILPQWWGCVADGGTDCTSAIRAASVAAAAGRAKVHFGPGSYLVTDEMVFALDRVLMVGEGQQVSIIQFNPSAANKAAFHFKNPGTTTIVQFSVTGLGFLADGNMQDGKAAIRITDGEEVIIDNVAVGSWTSTSANAIGLQFRGRQAHSISNITINADIPISIENNPNNIIDIDHYHFSNNFLIGHSAQPCVKVDTGIALTNVTFDGYQSWNVCKYGFYFNDAASPAGSGLSFKNARWEQSTDPAAWFIYLNANITQVDIENMYGAIASNGFYLRHVGDVTLNTLFYLGSLIGLDADSTASMLSMTNVHMNNAAATVNLSAIEVSGTYYLGGNVNTFLPRGSAGAGVSQQLNPSKTLSFSQLEPKTFTVNASSTVKFADDSLRGLVMISSNQGVSALLTVTGAFHTVGKIGDPDGWYGTAANALNFNLYWDAGTSSYRLQNNTMSPSIFSVVTMGVGER